MATSCLTTTFAVVVAVVSFSCGKPDPPPAVLACAPDGGCPSGMECLWDEPVGQEAGPSICFHRCPSPETPVEVPYTSPDCDPGTTCFAAGPLGLCAQPCTRYLECAPPPPGFTVTCDDFYGTSVQLCGYHRVSSAHAGADSD